jgi:hypothetical protein
MLDLLASGDDRKNTSVGERICRDSACQRQNQPCSGCIVIGARREGCALSLDAQGSQEHRGERARNACKPNPGPREWHCQRIDDRLPDEGCHGERRKSDIHLHPAGRAENERSALSVDMSDEHEVALMHACWWNDGEHVLACCFRNEDPEKVLPKAQFLQL